MAEAKLFRPHEKDRDGQLVPDARDGRTEEHIFRESVAMRTDHQQIEIGFLGGDRDILVNGQAKLAQGIADGIVCYLETRPEATATPGGSTSVFDPEATLSPE